MNSYIGLCLCLFIVETVIKRNCYLFYLCCTCSIKGCVEASNPRRPWDVWCMRRNVVQRSLDVWQVWFCRLCRLLPSQASSTTDDVISSRVRRVDDL